VFMSHPRKPPGFQGYSYSEFFIACPGSICEGPKSNKLALMGLKPWARPYSPFGTQSLPNMPYLSAIDQCRVLR
jgi:hypothetical protein